METIEEKQEIRKVEIECPWSRGIPRVSSPDPISLPITGCSLRFSQ